jgi:hypothetical protein
MLLTPRRACRCSARDPATYFCVEAGCRALTGTGQLLGSEVHFGWVGPGDRLRDETAGGQWSAELLQEAALVVASEIDWYKTHSIDQLSDLRVGGGVVTRDE